MIWRDEVAMDLPSPKEGESTYRRLNVDFLLPTICPKEWNQNPHPYLKWCCDKVLTPVGEGSSSCLEEHANHKACFDGSLAWPSSSTTRRLLGESSQILQAAEACALAIYKLSSAFHG